MPRNLSITPYAASLLSRELTLPAVVPSRTAMSLVVSPFGQLRKISMIRIGKSLISSPKVEGFIPMIKLLSRQAHLR